MKKIIQFCVGSILAANAVNADAVLMTYSFSGNATGWYDSQYFSGRDFTITLTANTDIINRSSDGLSQITGASSIYVEGYGEANFLDDMGLFARTTDGYPYGVLGFQIPDTLDLLNLYDEAFVNYDLSAELGPVIDNFPLITQWGNTNIYTTLGRIVLWESSGDVLFTASYSPVPVPAAAWLCGSGLLGLIGLGTKRKKG